MKGIRILLTALALTAAASLAGCSGAGDGESEAAAPPDAERIIVMGEITETVGNMLTLNLIVRREIPNLDMTELTEEQLEELRGSFTPGEPGNFSEMTEEDMAALREQFGDFFSADGEGPIRAQDGEGPIMQRRIPDGAEMIEGTTTFGRGREYTGETREIIIPAGAPIYESAFADGAFAETEISLDKLKTGDVIEVTYATDGETVAKVVKQQSAPMGRTRMGEDGFFPGGAVTENGEFFSFPVGGAYIGGGPAPGQ